MHEHSLRCFFSLFNFTIFHPFTVNSEEMGFKMIPLGVLQLTDMERKSSRANERKLLFAGSNRILSLGHIVDHGHLLPSHS